MKIKDGYLLRKVAGNCIVVGVGGIDLEGLVTINETGEFIWKMLASEGGASLPEIITQLAKACNVEEGAIESDVAEFIGKLKGEGIIE